jgi:tetratricopeptide (TPR) repeat protein
MIPKDGRSWLAFAVFQLVFAALIFGATRAYYTREPVSPAPATVSGVAEPGDATEWRPAISPELIASLTTEEEIADDPATMSHLADQYFANGDYAKAGEYYERLLGLDPDNADLRNNFGLTLQYTGRTQEALAQLAENVARHPGHQRSWLTLGFVSRQAGDVAAAREALTTAVGLDPDTSVGRSAQAMLDGL